MKATHDLIEFLDLAPAQESFLDAVRQGFDRPAKAIPCKFLYDQRGSELFDEICELPEYYPTRTETALLERYAPAIAGLIGPHCQLIEYGSGASTKVRLLLDALETPGSYVAVEISRTHLRQAASSIARDYPALEVIAICADYTAEFPLPPKGAGMRVGFFPGSTIGNFKPAEAQAFLANCARTLRGGGAMLVGVDLKKNPAVLYAAYNDSLGVTADFSLNLLARINRELGGDFKLQHFRHLAFYNADRGRIEIYIESLKDQQVSIGGSIYPLKGGERIHIEDSCKYSVDEFRALAQSSGFNPAAVWVDPQGLFSLHMLRAR